MRVVFEHESRVLASIETDAAPRAGDFVSFHTAAFLRAACAENALVWLKSAVESARQIDGARFIVESVRFAYSKDSKYHWHAECYVGLRLEQAGGAS